MAAPGCVNSYGNPVWNTTAFSGCLKTRNKTMLRKLDSFSLVLNIDTGNDGWRLVKINTIYVTSIVRVKTVKVLTVFTLSMVVLLYDRKIGLFTKKFY